MKTEFRVYTGVGIFILVMLLVYFFWSGDGGNSILLLATVGLGLLPGAYLGWWSRRMKPRPEDREVVEPGGVADQLGAFPTHSIWPFVLGVGAFLTALAFVFGIWTAVVGLSFCFSAALWGTLSSRRGGLI
ncbi:MAG: cytochrome c oxidase subunit 4 [Acidimicrobiales bacterium]